MACLGLQRGSGVVVVALWPWQKLCSMKFRLVPVALLSQPGLAPAAVCTSEGDVLTFLISDWCCKDGVM